MLQHLLGYDELPQYLSSLLFFDHGVRKPENQYEPISLMVTEEGGIGLFLSAPGCPGESYLLVSEVNLRSS